jgi:twinkle protein
VTNKPIKTHQPCGLCGSSDAATLFEWGTHCHSCNQNNSFSTPNQPQEVGGKKPINNVKQIRPVPTEFTALGDRRISESTAKRYGVTNITDETSEVKHVYPYYTLGKQPVHVANKLRRRSTKGFSWEGESAQAGLFGHQLFPMGSAKAITVVEGECDALAAYEMQGSRFPVVSVKSASTAPRDCAEGFEYLNSFETIVICFDRDEAKVQPDGTIRYPGQEAALSVAAMFPIGKVRILTLADAKDANDYLINGWADRFKKEWWAAPTYTPSGLKLGKDMWDEISTPKNYDTVLYPWDGMNQMTYGIRLSEALLITADTGVGKTSFLKEIEHHILKDPETTKKNYGIGFLHLEEPNADTALGLMSISADKPLHLPDVRSGVDEKELRGYYDDVINSERVVIWDHFGSNSIHEVLAKIRHMHNLGCKYIFLDHLSIIVSDQSGDERKQLDEISTKLKTLCMELNIAVIAVIHQNRQGQIRSSAGPEQISNIVVKLSRLKEDPDPWRRNVTKVVVQKNRFCGRTGPGVYLFYDDMSGRLRELDDEEISRYENGGGKGEDPWV